jgi:hypothetical protein
MRSYSWPVLVSSVVACAVWGAIIWWTCRRLSVRWYYLFVVLLATAFWFIGESFAIRLGKYGYEQFPLAFGLPGAGTPANPDWLARILRLLVPVEDQIAFGTLPADCQPINWNIPFPVIAFEGAIVFALFRIAVLRLRKGGFATALATASLCGILMVNFTAILDPVLSTARWCSTGTDLNRQGLHIGLWHWFNNEKHPGYWFGVPLANYAAWFLATGVFGLLAWLDEDSILRLVRDRRFWRMYLPAALVFLLAAFALLIPLQVTVDRLLVHGQSYLFDPHPVFVQSVWQFGIVLSLVALAVLTLFLWGRPHPDSGFDWISTLPSVAIFLGCAVALVLEWQLRIVAVWIVTAVIVAFAILWPFLRGRAGSTSRPSPEFPAHG